MKNKYGLDMKEFSPGGGFALGYQPKKTPLPISDYAKVIGDSVKKACDVHGFNIPKVILEPGRALIGRSGVSIYRIGSIKTIPSVRNYISIDGGSTAALVGHSGAGKSTIINLLPRFYDPNEGEIHIDGQNISDVKLSSLRKNISLVSQDIILFDDTVRSNIAYANLNASDKQIRDACNHAAATEFIEKLPQKFETTIGENGVRLSGGEKQRISIARAFLKNSPIILLDEATSSLDAESEEKVQNAVMNLTKNKTTLVIAHRLSTIIRADKIIVINQGKITDIGTHKELLENSIIYKNLYSKQLSA